MWSARRSRLAFDSRILASTAECFSDVIEWSAGPWTEPNIIIGSFYLAERGVTFRSVENDQVAEEITLSYLQSQLLALTCAQCR